jgi:hypothetical protein
MNEPTSSTKGPQQWMGPENYKAVSTYINWWLNGFLVALYTVTLYVGNYIFPSVQGIQKNALGDILMHIPRIAFDVKMFTQVGGAEHGQKCLFLWELVFVTFLVCIVFDIWLFFAVTRKLDPRKFGEFKVVQYFGAMVVIILFLYFLYFASDLSLYGGKFDHRKLPVNSTMFWFVVLVMLMVNMIVFHTSLFVHSYRRKKTLRDGKA